ncbi:MAG: tRNA (adenosine(37)-N6)-threonylcarbamoyltransferase complex ATPase subunit type 1 TsaE [Clostridia bacterium]|nr:tRNA (adenosine(37)-N6)-threonylcarbamoyltransferase complex ATPase subunit type 1 TsaE [Clostridia bacterium]
MKGIASFFNILRDVSSPTFTIVNEYSADKFKIFHFDVYRLKNSIEFENTIGTDYFGNGVCIIEWGEIIEDILPQDVIFIQIEKINENERKFNVRRSK